MNDKADIREVQKVRPDLNDNQANDVLNFLCDMYSQESYTMDNPQLFASAADLMFGEKHEH